MKNWTLQILALLMLLTAGVSRTASAHGYYGWFPWYGTWSAYGYSWWSYYGFLPRYSTFGAIAYDAETDAAGWAYGASTRWAAERSALDFCDTPECRTVIWVQGGCGAVARNEARTRVGWGMATTKYGAIRQAMRECRKGADGPCKLRAWTCSY